MTAGKFILTALLSLYSLASIAQSSDSTDVLLATQRFVRAFNNFDWPAFRAYFTSTATAFFPEPAYAQRAGGDNNLEDKWLELFPEFKDSANRFKMEIVPQDLLVQVYAQSAIVTFQMGKNTKHLSRRTLVFVKVGKDWKIAHLHASNLFAD